MINIVLTGAILVLAGALAIMSKKCKANKELLNESVKKEVIYQDLLIQSEQRLVLYEYLLTDAELTVWDLEAILKGYEPTCCQTVEDVYNELIKITNEFHELYNNGKTTGRKYTADKESDMALLEGYELAEGCRYEHDIDVFTLVDDILDNYR